MDYMEKRKIEILAIKEFMKDMQKETSSYDDIGFLKAYINGKLRAYEELAEYFEKKEN